MAADRISLKASIHARLEAAINDALRRAGDVSLQTLADLLRAQGYMIRQQELSAWRLGRIPDLDRFPAIAEALGVTWQWLLTGLDVEAVPGKATPPPESRGAPPKAPESAPRHGPSLRREKKG